MERSSTNGGKKIFSGDTGKSLNVPSKYVRPTTHNEATPPVVNYSSSTTTAEAARTAPAHPSTPCKAAQQHIRQQCVSSSMQRLLLHRSGISMFLRSPALSGTGDGSFRRSPLVEFGVGARFFADKTLCRRVRPAWRGRSREPRWGLGEPFRSGAY